jgi:hypothetical protein
MWLLLALVASVSGVTESPIICNLNALTKAEREQHALMTKQLETAVIKVEEVNGGYRIYLRPSMPAGALLTWVESERRCCPFLDFEIRLERENGTRWLQLTGREGVKRFLTAEFKSIGF